MSSLTNPTLNAEAKTWETQFFSPPSGTKFKIPNYQRQYSWGKNEVEEFWNDLNNESNLFFGTIMMNKTDNGFEIIDGQQRLLNITMVCSIIRNKLKDLGTSASLDQANNIQRDSISKSTNVGAGVEEFYFLEPAKSIRGLFRKHIQSKDGQPLSDCNLPADSPKEHKDIQDKYKSYNKKIDDELMDSDRPEVCQSKLVELHQKIKDLRIICVEIQDEIQAYEIFESVNVKGLDLGVSDLVKNKIFSSLHNRGSAHDELWQDMIQEVDGAGTSTKDYLKYFWWSKHGYVSDRGLYKKIKEQFRNPEDWDKFMMHLAASSEIYNHILSGEINVMNLYENNPRHSLKLLRRLKALRSFRNKTWVVLVLSMLRNRSKLSNNLKNPLEKLELYTFVYFHIYGLRSNYFHNRMYTYAQEIEALPTFPNPSDVNALFQKLWNELKNKFPPDKGKKIFTENFCEISYKDSTQGRALIRYILTKLERNHESGPPAGIDETIINIEHIIPRRPARDGWNLTSANVKPFVNNIGNLVALTADANSRLNNNSFIDKLETYSSEAQSFGLLKDLVDDEELEDSDPDKWKFSGITSDNYTGITKRSKNLAKQAWKVWMGNL